MEKFTTGNHDFSPCGCSPLPGLRRQLPDWPAILQADGAPGPQRGKQSARLVLVDAVFLHFPARHRLRVQYLQE